MKKIKGNSSTLHPFEIHQYSGGYGIPFRHKSGYSPKDFNNVALKSICVEQEIDTVGTTPIETLHPFEIHQYSGGYGIPLRHKSGYLPEDFENSMLEHISIKHKVNIMSILLTAILRYTKCNKK